MRKRADILAALALLGIIVSVRSILAHSTDLNPITTWPFDTDIYVVAAVFGWLYFRGLVNCRSRSRPIPRSKIALFYFGLALLFATLESPMDGMADHAFWIHQIQHLILRMVGPILIMLSEPLTPILLGLPLPVRQRVVRPVVRNPIVRRIWRSITHPVTASILYVGALYFWQIPRLHDLAILNNTIHNDGMHATMFMTGMLFWWIVIDPKPHHSKLHYGTRAILLGLVTFPNTLLGAVIVFSHSNLYTAYDQLGRLWHMTPRFDQGLGGIILWIPGDMMSVVGALILWTRWYREDKDQSDREAKVAIRAEWEAVERNLPESGRLDSPPSLDRDRGVRVSES